MTNQARPFQKEDAVFYKVKSKKNEDYTVVVCDILDYYYNPTDLLQKKKGWILLLLKKIETGEQLTIEKHWNQLELYYEK